MDFTSEISKESEINQSIAPALEKLEIIRQEKFAIYNSRKKNALRWGWILIVTCILLDIVKQGFPFITLGGLLIIFGYVTAPKRSYISSFKSQILPVYFKQFGGLSYSNHSHSAVDILSTTTLFKKLNNMVKEEDRIFGQINEFGLDFREITATTNQKSHGAGFKGAIILLTTPFNFSGHTLVISERREWFRRLGLDSTRIDLEKVKLESIEFEKSFETYGSDQVDTRYLLTPKMMEKIVQLKEAFSRLTRLNGLNIECKENKMLFAFEYYGDLIEPASIHTPATNISSLKETAKQISLVADIVSLLDLEYMANRKSAIYQTKEELNAQVDLVSHA